MYYIAMIQLLGSGIEIRYSCKYVFVVKQKKIFLCVAYMKFRVD